MRVRDSGEKAAGSSVEEEEEEVRGGGSCDKGDPERVQRRLFRAASHLSLF